MPLRSIRRTRGVSLIAEPPSARDRHGDHRTTHRPRPHHPEQRGGQASRPDQAEGDPGRGREVLRSPGHLAALLDSREHAGREPSSRKGSASTGRRSAGSRRSTRATCCCSRTSPPRSWIRCSRCRRLSLTCDIYDPVTLEPYSRDPRFIAFKAEEYLKTSGIATTSYWGPEAEFFIFNSVRFDQNAYEGVLSHRFGGGDLELGRGTGPRTWGTGPGTRRGTSRCRRWTGCRTCGRRSCSR